MNTSIKIRQNSPAFLSVVAHFLAKPSTLAAAIVFAAGSISSTSFAQTAETDYLMPTGPGGGQPDDGVQPFDSNPSATGSETRQFLTYGYDADNNVIPPKTLRITNNTAQTVYPIMRDPNSNVLTSNPAIGLYDPYDPANKEYRGYIGYEEGGKYYFGLKPGQSILVNIPLVFWNGARIGIGTDGQYLTPAGLPNPLRYDPNAHRSIVRAEASADTIPNGFVMWYRAEIAQAPNDDTEDQLAEWTIRDHTYLVNPQITAKTNNEIPDNQLVTLINYDVSNVDNLYLPLAMASNDVWVVPQGSGTGPTPNRTGWIPGSHPDSFGWTGAVNTIDFLQSHIQKFTADSNQLLGNYFGGKGWPYYNIPNPTADPNAPRKIPSGANIFAQSPLKATPTSYGNGQWQNDKYMLSSGGTKPISATIGWAGGTPDTVGSTMLHLNTAESEKIAFIEPGYNVTGVPPDSPPTPNPIQAGTTVKSVHKTEGWVELSSPLVASSQSCAFKFTRPVSDYASEAMIRLWYSWAQYFLAHWHEHTTGVPSAPLSGSIQANTATLTFNEPHPELLEGMAVTGPGLDNAQTEVNVHQGDAVILEISGDHKSVILSQVANTTSVNAPFAILAPQPLLWTPSKEGDPGWPLIGDQFVFDDEPAWRNPYEFAREVYLVMASMNQIGHENNDSVSKFMQDVIGANMGYIFTNAAKKTEDAQTVIAMIRDKIKSVLRGVTDFTKYPDLVDDHGNHLRWYPDPKERHGNQLFNVYNLDPFVWFVHVQLGFSGYGFSVDDDTADVGAGGASQLQLTITSTGGLKKTASWTIQAPYGPVPYDPGHTLTLYYSGEATDTNGDTLYNAISNVSSTTPVRITTPGQHHLANGDQVLIDQVDSIVDKGLYRIGNVTKTTFDLFDAATGAVPVSPLGGTYTGGGRWAYPLHPYIDTISSAMPGNDLTTVFYRVTGDDALGTFLGTFVSVNGVDRDKTGEKFRIWQLGRQSSGRLLLASNLTDANGNKLPAGNYAFRFFGISESTPTPTPSPTPTPAPTPSYQPTVNAAQRDLRTIKRSIKKAQRTQTGRERKQTVAELKFCQQVARAVTIKPWNMAIVKLLKPAMKATKIKNDRRRANKFKALKKEFRRIR